MSKSTLQSFLDICQSTLTSVAIVVGGFMFLYQRGCEPQAVIRHKLAHRTLDAGHVLLSLRIDVSNEGNGLLELRQGRLWVEQVVPLAPGLDKQLADGTAVKADTGQIQFPAIRGTLRDPLALDRDIEPHEKDYLWYDFSIPSGVTTVRVYTYLRNEEHRERGWEYQSEYDLDDGTVTWWAQSRPKDVPPLL